MSGPPSSQPPPAPNSGAEIPVTPERIEEARIHAEREMQKNFSLLTNPAHHMTNAGDVFRSGIAIFAKRGRATFERVLAEHIHRSAMNTPDTQASRVAAIGLTEFGKYFGIDVGGAELKGIVAELKRAQEEQAFRNLHALDITVDLSHLVAQLQPLRHEQELQRMEGTYLRPMESIHDDGEEVRHEPHIPLHEIPPSPPEARTDELDKLYSTLIGHIRKRIELAYIPGKHGPVKFFDESVDLAIREHEDHLQTPLSPYVRDRLELFRDFVKHEYLGVANPTQVRQAMREALDEVVFPAKTKPVRYSTDPDDLHKREISILPDADEGEPQAAEPMRPSRPRTKSRMDGVGLYTGAKDGQRITDHLRTHIEPVRHEAHYFDADAVEALARKLMGAAMNFEERHEIKRYFTAKLAPELARNSPLQTLTEKALRRFFAKMEYQMPPRDEQTDAGYFASQDHPKDDIDKSPENAGSEDEKAKLPERKSFAVDFDLRGLLESYSKTVPQTPSDLPFDAAAFHAELKDGPWTSGYADLLTGLYIQILASAFEQSKNSSDADLASFLDHCLDVGLQKVRNDCSVSHFELLSEQVAELRHSIKHDRMQLREPQEVRAAMTWAIHEALPRLEDMGENPTTSVLRIARDGARQGHLPPYLEMPKKETDPPRNPRKKLADQLRLRAEDFREHYDIYRYFTEDLPAGDPRTQRLADSILQKFYTKLDLPAPSEVTRAQAVREQPEQPLER